MPETLLDIEITCVRCHRPFIWSAKDQARYKEKKYEPPKNCPPCREKKKQERRQAGLPA